MATHSDSAEGGTQKHHHFDVEELLYRAGRVVLLAVLFIAILLLGQTMVHHRFFRGGHFNRSGTLTQ
jgi:uncharacterized phosphosugar-binding protein